MDVDLLSVLFFLVYPPQIYALQKSFNFFYEIFLLGKKKNRKKEKKKKRSHISLLIQKEMCGTSKSYFCCNDIFIFRAMGVSVALYAGAD